jgi:hypothetical protein
MTEVGGRPLASRARHPGLEAAQLKRGAAAGSGHGKPSVGLADLFMPAEHKASQGGALNTVFLNSGLAHKLSRIAFLGRVV